MPVVPTSHRSPLTTSIDALSTVNLTDHPTDRQRRGENGGVAGNGSGDRGQSNGPPNGVHAAIDIGTNSFHMVVARRLADGGFEVIDSMKDMVRLGQGSGEMKVLADDAIERGMASLARMAAVAATHGADITAVATSATREAENRQVFLRRARQETGIEIDVISGFEEARLIHLGVLQALPVFDRQLLLIDIGGGSTEFLVGHEAEVLDARSVKLGAIRLTERFFGDGSAPPKRVKRCRADVAATLATVARELGQLGHEVTVGSSGTISAIASLIAAARGEEIADLNGFRFTAGELDELVSVLIGTSTKERTNMSGMDARRADIIVGGTLLLEGAFTAFGIEEMTVSGYALREGVLFDRLAADLDRSARRLTNLRRSNIERLANQLDPDAVHAETAARLALALFDQTRDLHRLGSAARELLELAALVHNVGLFISHAAHHKHTYYVVRHSEQLTGFTEREREILALVARYHRRSHPKSRHPEFAALPTCDQNLVRTLAGLLRVAIGLDRGHRGVVADVRVEFEDGGKQRRLRVHPVLAPESPPDVDLALEVFSAQERADLLADALELDVQIEEPSTRADDH